MAQIIRMKKDYQVSYKFGMMLKGNNYEVKKLPAEIQAAVPRLLKSGWAIEIEKGATAFVGENLRSKQLEEKKIEAVKVAAEQQVRQEVAQQSVQPRGRRKKTEVIEEVTTPEVPVEVETIPETAIPVVEE